MILRSLRTIQYPPDILARKEYSPDCTEKFTQKSPDIAIGAFCLTFRSNWVPGSVLLSHGECHTTIGATAFHFCVRHGYRWFHCAIAARQNLQSGIR